MLAATLVGRHVFYNNSVFDDHSAAAGPADDAAIATDKRVLLPGETATFANYTAYSRGINGLMVDIRGLPEGEGPQFDFQFSYAETSEWDPAPEPRSVTTRRGAGVGGSDRVTITWNDGVIRNRWLHVVVNAGGNTGLAARDDFYVGNRVAETGDDPSAALVTAADVLATRAAISRAAAGVGSKYDHNRDGRVNALDVEIARRNRSNRRIELLAVPATPVPRLSQVRLTNDTGSDTGDGVTSDLSVRGGVSNERYLAEVRVGLDDALPAFWFDARPLFFEGQFRFPAEMMETVNGGPLAQGAHALHLRAVDPRGNSSDTNLSFTYDSVAPVLTLDPAPRGLVTGNVMLTGRATDAGGAATDVGVSRDDGGAFSADMNGDRFTYDARFDPGGSDDGQHTLRVRAVDLAGNESSTAELTFFVLTRALGALPGPGMDSANSGLPLLPVPDAPLGDFTDDNRPEGTGLPTSRTRLVVHFAAAATRAQANAVLASLGAVAVGTVPDAEAVVIAIPDTADLAAMDAALASLTANPAVALVTSDVALGFTSLPGPTPLAAGFGNSWKWELPTNPVSFDGNWGLNAMRVPQMWSLNTMAARTTTDVRTGVLDAGFNDPDNDGISNHPLGDLAGLRTYHFQLAPGPAAPGGNGSSNFHGEHVAGVIGAVFNDNVGVEGINPFVEPRNPGDGHFIGVPDSHGWATHLSDLALMLNAWPDLRVVNISMGSNWYEGTPPVDANTSLHAHLTEQNEGLFVRKIMAAHPRTLIFAAAGNDSDTAGFPKEIDARWTSPFDWAALGPAVDSDGVRWGQSTNIIVVEALGPYAQGTTGDLLSYAKADFSNVGGHVSAPGQAILSTVGHNLPDFDTPNRLFFENYESLDGTSMATPHVTGLVSYLMRLNPTLTPIQLRDLLLDSRFTRDTYLLPADQNRLPAGVTAPAPMVDAFAAALGLDVLLEDPNKSIQRALVDVDDGTRDGNLRVDPLTNSPFNTVATPDQRRGDGHITMRDFRAYRDAYLQVFPDLGFGSVLPVSLDGPANHFKKDLNFDGVVNRVPANQPHPEGIPQPSASLAAWAPLENTYSRYDFNGDGRIGEWYVTAPFKIDPDTPHPSPRNDLTSVLRAEPGFLRDIDVMADPAVWQDLAGENVTTNTGIAGLPVSAGRGPFDTWAYLLSNIDQDNAAVPAALRMHPDYFHSFDAHVNVDWTRLDPALDALYVTIRSKIHGAEIDAGWHRSVRIERGRSLTELTVPLWTGDVSFEVAGVDLQDPSLPANLDDLVGNVIDWHGLAFGQDKALSLPVYRIVDLGRLGQGTLEGDYWSEANAVNNRGQVVGNSSTSFLDKNGSSIEHGFLWEDLNGNGVSDPGEMVDLVPGGSAFSGDAVDINDRGEATGAWYSETTPYEEIYVRRDGVPQGTGVRGYPGGINDSGVIVGGTVISTPTGDAVRAFRQGPGGVEILGSFGGYSRAEGINSLGHVVGTSDDLRTSRAFVSRDGTTLTLLPNPPDPFNGGPNNNTSFALDINDAGWIAGYYFSIWGNRTVAWDPDGVVWDVGGSANEATYPRAINESGTIVGYADPFPNGLPNHAFMVRVGGGPIDLNTLLPPNSGWRLLAANDINDRGEIVGTGIFNDWYHAYLLTTVPGPAGRRTAPAPAAAPPAPPETGRRSAPPQRRGGYADSGSAATSAQAAAAGPPAAAPSRLHSLGATDLLRPSTPQW